MEKRLMENLLEDYYGDNARKVRKLVDRIFNKKYGGVSEQDMDEFYSVANDVFADIICNDRYDSSKGEFEGFLYRALDLAIVDEIKKQNRDKRVAKAEIGEAVDGRMKKRKVPVPDISLDAPIGDGVSSRSGI